MQIKETETNLLAASDELSDYQAKLAEQQVQVSTMKKELEAKGKQRETAACLGAQSSVTRRILC